ncbi:MAG: biotin-dependent carboxyltransferase family protein [Pseudomonadota bacterium]
MSRVLHILKASPGVTVQDLGRPGYLTYGVSQGGAADPIALAEGAALLGATPGAAALEMATLGGTFSASEDLRIALTGAPMRATLDGTRLAWNASHWLPAGAELTIGTVETGVYGYLSVGGGLTPPPQLGSRSAHLAAGIGRAVTHGDALPVGPDTGTEVRRTLPPLARFGGGTIRVVPSLQTALFPQPERTRFESTPFQRDPRANRMGARLAFEGAGFAPAEGRSILSEVVVPGDIQITGDGTPFVLMRECQTVGGYPRIGSVLPSDLARVAQAEPGATLRFQFLSLQEAAAIEAQAANALRALPSQVTALYRDPRHMSDLLSYQLVSGVVSALP